MISIKHAKEKVRKGELTKIENYDKAVADKSQMWVCHHRLELTLDGEFAHSQEELERMGMYYHRPYFELIFLTDTEHRRLHGKAKSEENLKSITEAMKRRKLSEEHKKKISEANKGRKLSDEHKKKISEGKKKQDVGVGKKISEALKGRKLSEETRKKLSKPNSDFGRKYFEHFGYGK